MEKKENCIIQTSLTVLFIAICIWGIGTSIAMNYVNRSLWLDEAMLSYSFGQRGLLNLCSSKFEANQIAPVGWLYLVKLITVICGNTEFTLRIASIFFYGLTIAALHFYIYKCLGCSQMLALASSALSANFPLILKYSNVFKPYIADGFFVLLVLIAFASYCNEKKKAWQLCLIWCVLIWFQPCCFCSGGLPIS